MDVVREEGVHAGGGLIRAVMGLGPSAVASFSSPLFFCLLTVALVAAIHIASGFISSHPRSEDEDTEKKGRRGGFAAGDEAADVTEDGILEMMRSFSFVHASEECFFMEGMATYDFPINDGGPHNTTAPPEPAPASSSLSFRFQYQMPEAAAILREISVDGKEEHEREKKPSIPWREHEDEAEEEEEESREVVAAAPEIVSAVHNYRFLTERDFRGFVVELAAVTLRVKESFVPSLAPPEERIVVDFATENEFRPANEKPSAAGDRVAPAGKRTPVPVQSRKQPSSPTDASKGSAVSERPSEFSGFGDSDSESSASDDGYSVKELAVDSDSDWFLSEQDFPAAAHDASILMSNKAKVLNAMEALEEMDTLERSFQDSATTMSPASASPDSIRDGSAMWSRSPSPDADYKSDDENDQKSISSVSDHNKNSQHSDRESVTRDDHSHGATVENISEPAEDEQADQEGKGKDLTEEEDESLREHHELIEQLKKGRSVGLPTIMEEPESPKAPMEDLKPWRIDAKLMREDPMEELHKFYKSYRERMRKFDILCYQKMYAIDFLQLRRPRQSANSLKTLAPTVSSILSHNFQSSRRRPSAEDPSERFLKELRHDLETVYVGQTCLSWEFLRWQYEQACDNLPESDSYHSHQYNRVAGEFQQFQVVLQRFVEDESYKGPRLPNYINNRCVLRALLQVPVVKEDSLTDRREDQRKGNYVVTSEELEEVMEESMRVLWEFIKADRAETAAPVIKSFSGAHVELQDPLDRHLMMHIHATLQKKEKRLKDVQRTGNCVVKKLKKKPKEKRSNRSLFFSQVDMRLVARVLRMPRITGDQLQWCKAKLDKIVLVDNRKIHRESSFLLFPC